MLYCKQQQQQSDSTRLFDVSAWSERSLKMQLVELAMERHRFSLQEGPIDIYQWRNFDKKSKIIG